MNFCEQWSEMHDNEDEGPIEKIIVEGINSGEPLEVSPAYWEAKHRRLDERLRGQVTREHSTPANTGVRRPRFSTPNLKKSV